MGGGGAILLHWVPHCSPIPLDVPHLVSDHGRGRGRTLHDLPVQEGAFSVSSLGVSQTLHLFLRPSPSHWLSCSPTT